MQDVPDAALLKQCRAAFDWWARWSSSGAGSAAMFAWAVAEAIVWPIIPDFLLVPMVAGNRARYYVPLAAAALGSALGGACLYLFALRDHGHALALLARLPAVGPHAVAAARADVAARGPAAFLYQPWSGIPFKVWAIAAGAAGLNPVAVIPTFVVARTLRMAVFATLARVLAGRFLGFVRDFSLFLAVIYVALFFFGWWGLVSG